MVWNSQEQGGGFIPILLLRGCVTWSKYPHPSELLKWQVASIGTQLGVVAILARRSTSLQPAPLRFHYQAKAESCQSRVSGVVKEMKVTGPERVAPVQVY